MGAPIIAAMPAHATQGSPLMPVRQIFRACLLAGLLFGAMIGAAAEATGPGLAANASVPVPTQIELFVNEGCPHCAAARKFLDELSRERADLQVTIIDVRFDPGAIARLQALSRAAGIAQPGVPTLRIGK